MPVLEFEVTETPAQKKLEVTCIDTLSAGGAVKAEIGEHELSEVVPEGKQWYVVTNVRVIETDA